MSRIPAKLDINDLQQAFRELWDALDPLLLQVMNFRGRRVTNAGDAQLDSDLATLGQVREKLRTVAGPSSSGYNQIQDEGTNLGKRHILNFIGAGIAATDAQGSRTNVTVSTASATQEGTVSTGAQTFAGTKTLNPIFPGSAYFTSGTGTQLIRGNNTLIAGINGTALGIADVTTAWILSLDTSGSLGLANNLGVVGTVNAAGYRVSGTAVSGNVLRGNGTNFVSATLAAADLSNGVSGSGNVILKTSAALTTPTLTTPAISDFTSATHGHISAATGGQLAFDGGVFTGAVTTVNPTVPNRTVTLVINGATYYLAAKTTND